jgi:hypothetical protein
MGLDNRYDEHTDNKFNKFVITEDGAFFVPYLNRVEAPPFKEILGEIFDLDNPEVFREVDGKLDEGRIILGHSNPYNKEVDVPLETSEYGHGFFDGVSV